VFIDLGLQFVLLLDGRVDGFSLRGGESILFADGLQERRNESLAFFQRFGR
jgi:hypothetical protein